MRFEVLYNFISPITGRILCDPDYILLGDRRGVGIPSPIVIDIRLDLVQLRQKLNSLIFDFDNLRDSSFIIGFPNEKLPNAQVLNALPNGFLFNIEGILSSTEFVPLDGLPDLTFKKIWRGNNVNRPVESDDLTTAESNISALQLNVSDLLGDVANLVSLYNGLQTAVNGLEEGLASVGGWIAILALIASVGSLGIRMGTAESNISDLEEDVSVIQGRLDDIDTQITNIFANIDAITLRIDNLRLNTIFADDSVSFYNQRLILLADPINPTDGVNLRTLESYVGDFSLTLEGDVTGSGTIGTPIETELQLTLDEIKVAENTVDLNNQKIINLQTDNVQEQDALNFKFFWDFMHNRIEVSWS